MDKPRLLIACNDPEFSSSIDSALPDCLDTHCCHSGHQALQLLREHGHDLLLLDLMLPEMDGLALLQAAAQEGIQPQVLVMLDFHSPYILEALTRLQVSYVILKPCSIGAVLTDLLDMASRIQRRLHPAPRSLTERQAIAAQALLELGINPSWDGFDLLQMGLPLFAQDTAQAVTKELYWSLGKAFGKRSILIERNIRSAVHKSWLTGNMAVWRKYFPCAPDGTVPRPSNKYFIARLARVLFADGEALAM